MTKLKAILAGIGLAIMLVLAAFGLGKRPKQRQKRNVPTRTPLPPKQLQNVASK